MKQLLIAVVCLLGVLAAGPALHAEPAAPAAPAAVELDGFLASLAPAEAAPAEVPFLAASCTQVQCVAKCDCGPAPCVSVCHSLVGCLCHCEILNPRRRC